MYELEKNGKVFTSKSVGTGPSSYEKRIYRTAVSPRLKNTALESQTWVLNCSTSNPYSPITTHTHTYGMPTVDHKPYRAICNSRPFIVRTCCNVSGLAQNGHVRNTIPNLCLAHNSITICYLTARAKYWSHPYHCPRCNTGLNPALKHH